MKLQPTIGLEIHAQLNTKSKMFCACKNDPDSEQPNVNICPICMAHPGTLPNPNQEAVYKVVKAGLALNCEIEKESKFDRKNYFYPDLPKGYQISQYDRPLCRKGYLLVNDQKIRITRIHLEEDSAKSIHKGNYSLVDYNRAGAPLMELVTEPDFKDGLTVEKFGRKLQRLWRYLGVSEANMEKAQMRVEVNISLSKTEKKGTKVEIKNLNSFRAAKEAIEYEIKRQKKVLQKEKEIQQETRGWTGKKTVSQRKKEEAADYRYFPDPDLPSIKLTDKKIKEIKSEIPELPEQKRIRFKKEYGISEEDIETFLNNKDLADYFEKAESQLKNWVDIKNIKEPDYQELVRLLVNYITSDLKGLLGKKSVTDSDFKITPENLAELISLIFDDKISSRVAKKVLKEMYKTGIDPSQYIEEKGLKKISGQGKLKEIAQKIISNNPEAVEDYRQGKEEAVKFLLGQIMRETKGKADPQQSREIIVNILKE